MEPVGYCKIEILVQNRKGASVEQYTDSKTGKKYLHSAEPLGMPAGNFELSVGMFMAEKIDIISVMTDIFVLLARTLRVSIS